MSNFDQNVWKKLNAPLFKALESATVFCKLRGSPYVELEHWLQQLYAQDDNDIKRILSIAGVAEDTFETAIFDAVSKHPTNVATSPSMSEHVIQSIQKAWMYASLSMSDTTIRGAWLLGALWHTPELKHLLLKICPDLLILNQLDWVNEIPSRIRVTNEGNSTQSAPDGMVPGEFSQAVPGTGSKKSSLEQYCLDLTQQAREGRIDPVIGRENELRALIDILLRRRQNNPLLTGEAGVGKTAVVEGFALAVTNKQVPPALFNIRVMSLDVGALIAGASMKGEFESRLKSLIEEIKQATEPIILFIDEIHTLVGAGGQAGVGDAANLLKPALARGGLRTIGATTWSEYKKYIEKDPALTRRFQVVQVHEPTLDVATNMVRGQVAAFAKHHQVLILDDAVQASVQLSARYIPARQLPDKAISLLDTACARVALALHTPPSAIVYLRERVAAIELEIRLADQALRLTSNANPEQKQQLQTQLIDVQTTLSSLEAHWIAEQALVQEIQQIRTQLELPETTDDTLETAKEALRRAEQQLLDHQADQPLVRAEVTAHSIADIVSDWTGIPLGRMLQDDINTIVSLADILNQRVIGQDHALQNIARRIRTARSGLSDPNKPVGVFMLVGPSGVGKTETALALAEQLYGGEQNLITINMSEYQESHTVSLLKGAPPGYVGYGEGGVLTEAVRRRPYSVVLLDEIEKAHRDVHEMFYQIFDKGWMEDSEGKEINFRNCVILLTSNTGSELIETMCNDDTLLPTETALVDALQPELRQIFPAAFLGRLVIVPYLPLAESNLEKIVRLHLGRVVTRMATSQGVDLSYTDSVIKYIVDMCGTHETGVRRLIQFIEQTILPELAIRWFDALKEKTTLTKVEISMQDDLSTIVYNVS